MTVEVFLAIGRVREALVTSLELTLERLLASVAPFVNAQVLRSCELLATPVELTFERLLTSVNAHVIGQLVLGLEWRITPGAAGPEAHVGGVAIARNVADLDVTAQLGRGGITSTTHVALIGPATDEGAMLVLIRLGNQLDDRLLTFALLNWLHLLFLLLLLLLVIVELIHLVVHLIVHVFVVMPNLIIVVPL